MLKKFMVWFVVFALSFLVDTIGLAEQGKAFLFIHIGITVFIILCFIVIIMAAGIAYDSSAKANSISFLTLLTTFAVYAVILFATWVATKPFGVNFYVAYQIMTFGQCLCTDADDTNN